MKKSLSIAALLFSCMLFWLTAVGKTVSITNQKQFDDLLKKDFVILKFTADWCSACKLSKKPFEELATKNEFAQVHFATVNTDNNAEIAKKYGITTIPRFIFIKGGKEVHTKKGIPNLSLFDQYFSDIIKRKLLKQEEAPPTPAQHELDEWPKTGRQVPDEKEVKEDEKGMFEGAKQFFQEYFEWFKSFFKG